ARAIGDTGLERSVRISWADITPTDLASVIDTTDQQRGFMSRLFGQADATGQTSGDRWIRDLLDLPNDQEALKHDPRCNDIHPGTIDGVKRRVGFVHAGANRIFREYAPIKGKLYDSILPDLLVAMERGRLVIVDTTLMSEIEQFMLTTV